MVKKRPKPKPKQVDAQKEATTQSIDESIIAAALSCKSQTVLMKVCRLCESKDGPFLNIFDFDTITIKKIDEIMPFVITENDDLPHKICFRCSAKVEELYEFIQKCIKTQENLRTELGKKGPLYTKTKTRILWEKKLNQTNLSNDDICNALIKKAMEGIKDIPLNSSPSGEEIPLQTSIKKEKGNTESSASTKKDAPDISKPKSAYQSDDEHDEVSLKQVKLTIEKCDDKVPLTRASRSQKSESLLEGLPDPPKKLKQNPLRKVQDKVETISVDNKPKDDKKQSDRQNINPPVIDVKTDESKKVVPSKVEPSPINIMDHVSIIKVNGVGTLFLCKLCNRNFLKKDVVYTHGCAKNNVPKDNFLHNQVSAPPQVPKPSTVKYIKMDRDFNKPVVANKEVVKEKKLIPPNVVQNNTPVQPEVKPKHKAGPASRVQRTQDKHQKVPAEPTPPSTNVTPENKVVMNVPAVSFPGLPSLNARYKLVPGPDNIFTLVEDSTNQNEDKTVSDLVTPVITGKKRKASNVVNNTEMSAKYHQPKHREKEPSPEILFDEDDDIPPQPAVEQPYPVGLFQTVPHHSGVFAPTTHPAPPTFTTPAMKKQSYTVVQTGNPSKLLISAKPQPNTEEARKKKKYKLVQKDSSENVRKEPFNINIGDTGSSKDSGFFTFINVDPLSQPSYVLPTDNIIQESQISTSTPASKAIIDSIKEKEKYECNMCSEKFSREKKLLTHIQSHYNQMDEEDQRRAEKAPSKRKTRKS